MPSRGLGEPRVKCRQRGVCVLGARQVKGVCGYELGREITHEPLGEQKVGRAMGQSLAIGAHGVEVQKSVFNLALRKPSYS